MDALAKNEGRDTYGRCANSLIICLNGMQKEYIERGDDVLVTHNRILA